MIALSSCVIFEREQALLVALQGESIWKVFFLRIQLEDSKLRGNDLVLGNYEHGEGLA